MLTAYAGAPRLRPQEQADRVLLTRRFLGTYADLAEAAPRLFQPEHDERFKEVQRKAMEASVRWGHGAVCAYAPDVYPYLAMTIPGQGRVGLDFFTHRVDPEEQEWPSERPMPCVEEGYYSTLYTFSTFALLMQAEAFRTASPTIHLHVLCKGLREFNAGNVRPKFPNPETRRLEELITYVHSLHNMADFMGRWSARGPLSRP